MNRGIGIFAIILAATLANAQTPTSPPKLVLPANNTAVLNVLSSEPQVTPIGPYDLLRSYEGAMSDISGRMTQELTEVSKAVDSGQLDPNSADYISEQCYELAIMQYELLSVLHADLAKSIADAQQSNGNTSAEHGSASTVAASWQNSASLRPNTRSSSTGIQPSN